RGRIWALGYRGMFRVSTPLPPLGTAPIVATPMTGPIDLRMLTMDSHGILRAWHNGSLVTVQLDTRKDDPRWDTVRYAPAHNGSQAGSHRVAALGLLTVPDTVLGKNHGVHTTGVVQFDEAGNARSVGHGPIMPAFPFGAAVDVTGALWISSVDKLWRMSPDGARTSRVLPVSHDHNRLV